MNSLKNCFVATAGSNKAGNAMPKIISSIFLSIILLGCGSSNEEIRNKESYAKQKLEEEARAASLADSVSAAEATPVTDTINGVGYNFIRRANIKCKVKNVLETGTKIEDIVAQYGGHVILNDYRTENNYTNEIKIRKDTLAQVTYFTPQNYITAKVPARLLDSVLRKVVNLAEFVDYKRSSADNIKLQLLANKFIVKRANNSISKTIKNEKEKSNKFKDSEAANDNIAQKQQLADETQIRNLELIDRVNYSEINLELYQGMSNVIKLLPVQIDLKPYEPNYFVKLGTAFTNGLKILSEIVLVIINCWGVFALLVGGFLICTALYKRYLKKLIFE